VAHLPVRLMQIKVILCKGFLAEKVKTRMRVLEEASQLATIV